MRTEGRKIVWQPKQEPSLVVFEMLVFLWRNKLSQITTLTALVEAVQKHAEVFESTRYADLPESSKGFHWQFAAWLSQGSV